MTEGRWFPWKEQEMDIRPHPDYTVELKKPLKAPPPGLEWRRLDDGNWELRRRVPVGPMNVALGVVDDDDEQRTEPDGRKEDGDDYDDDEESSTENTPKKPDEPKMPEFLEHVVTEEDTLTGICMRYKVKARELRQLNDFVGDHFRLCPTLIVPNRLFVKTKSIQTLQPPTKATLLQKFRNISMLTHAEAKYYMEECEWNVDKALILWRADRDWEQEQQKAPTQMPSPVSERGSRKRRQWSRASSRVGPFAAISGTVNSSDYVVTNEGHIELGGLNGDLAEARVPLLSGRPMRLRINR